MTDLTLIANCDKFVSKNLDVNGKKWVLEGPADKNLSFAALDCAYLCQNQRTGLSGLQTPQTAVG